LVKISPRGILYFIVLTAYRKGNNQPLELFMSDEPNNRKEINDMVTKLANIHPILSLKEVTRLLSIIENIIDANDKDTLYNYVERPLLLW
jgi:hypothetical protein